MQAKEKEKNRFTAEDYYNTPEGYPVELVNGRFIEKYTGRIIEDPLICAPGQNIRKTMPIKDMGAPSRAHQEWVTILSRRIGNYIEDKGGSCRVYVSPFDVKLKEDDDTVFQPDISVICDEKKLTDKGCLGAPDWIIEVLSPGNASLVYIVKLKKYLDAGVREYWIVDPQNETVDVCNLASWNLDPAEYTFLDKIKAGIYEDLYLDFKEMYERIRL